METYAPGVAPELPALAGGRTWLRIALTTFLATAASAGLCYTAYWLAGVRLFPSGTVGWILALAPVVTPLVVAPLIAVPAEAASRKVRELLAEVEATRVQLAAEVRERAATQAALEELVRRDPLTGLLNRRGFFERWASERHDERIVLSVDVDEFKSVNDRLGHAAGDRVLEGVAAALRSGAGDGADVARVGGDEFVVTLAARAADTAEALRLQLAALPVRLDDGSVTTVRASVGAAVVARGMPVDDALAEADARMYEAKRKRARHRPRARTAPADPARSRVYRRVR
jgi:diguanylate cyclase (GGDEF)-like protein